MSDDDYDPHEPYSAPLMAAVLVVIILFWAGIAWWLL